MTTAKNQRWEINVQVTEALQLRRCQYDNVCKKSEIRTATVGDGCN